MLVTGVPPISFGLDLGVLRGVISPELVPLGAELSAVVVHWPGGSASGDMQQCKIDASG